MTEECKAAFSRAKELIFRNKKKFGNIIPEVQSFDYGNIHVQYFIDWEDFWEKTKIKRFNNLNDKLKDIKLVFSEKDNDVDVQDFNCNKTYIILNGEIDFKFEDGTIKKVSSYESLDVPKGMSHGGLTVRDTYVVVIES